MLISNIDYKEKATYNKLDILGSNVVVNDYMHVFYLSYFHTSSENFTIGQ